MNATRLLLAGALLLSPAASVPAEAQANNAAPAEPRRFTFPRAAQQDAKGFYFQPAGLCDD